MKTCPSCGITRPMQAFRRWRAAKKIWTSVCSTCDPPKTLKEMGPRERVNEAAHNRAHIMRVNAMTLLEKRKRAVKKQHEMLLYWNARRREEWRTAILARLLNERRWVKGRAKAADAAAADAAAADAADWLRFLSEYDTTLAKILGIAQQHATRTGGALAPTPEQTNPRSYISEAEYVYLKRLYAAVYAAEGGATINKLTHRARSPWLLGWKEVQGTQTERGDAAPLRATTPDEGESK